MFTSRPSSFRLMGLFLVLGMVMAGSWAAPSWAEDDAESPESIAKENADEGKRELEESDKGTTEDGEKIWKAEARDWLDFEKHSDHCTFELSAKLARELTEQFYKAGADKVWMTSISETETDGTKLEITDNMVVVLGFDQAKRKAIFAVYNKMMEEADEPPLKDIGQKYIFITGD